MRRFRFQNLQKIYKCNLMKLENFVLQFNCKNWCVKTYMCVFISVTGNLSIMEG